MTDIEPIELTKESAAPQPQPKPDQGRRMALEFAPLLLFFAVNSLWQPREEALFAGTAVLVPATIISVFLMWRLERRIPFMPLIGCFFVTVFGALTFAFDDTLFIKLKPTVTNLVLASALVVGNLLGRNVLKLMLDSVLNLTDEGWRGLAWRFVAFFLFLAGLNEVIWRNFSDDFWAAFKVWGLMPISIGFSMSQLPYIQRHVRGPVGQGAG